MEERVLETERLVLRRTVFEDCDYFVEWEELPEVNQNLWITNDHSYKEIVTDFIHDSQDPAKEQFVIVQKKENRPIGRILITKINHEADSCNLTRVYIADLSLRRQGYGEEAVRAVLEYCFIQLHMERVSLDHLKGDEAAASLSRKLGCVEEGVMRHAAKRNGKYVDLYRMSLLRAEYYDRLHDR